MGAYDADVLPFREAGLQVVNVQEGVVPVQLVDLVLHPVNSGSEGECQQARHTEINRKKWQRWQQQGYNTRWLVNIIIRTLPGWLGHNRTLAG